MVDVSNTMLHSEGGVASHPTHPPGSALVNSFCSYLVYLVWMAHTVEPLYSGYPWESVPIKGGVLISGVVLYTVLCRWGLCMVSWLMDMSSFQGCPYRGRRGMKASRAKDKLLSHHFYPHRLYIVNLDGDFQGWTSRIPAPIQYEWDKLSKLQRLS